MAQRLQRQEQTEADSWIQSTNKHKQLIKHMHAHESHATRTPKCMKLYLERKGLISDMECVPAKQVKKIFRQATVGASMVQ